MIDDEPWGATAEARLEALRFGERLRRGEVRRGSPRSPSIRPPAEAQLAPLVSGTEHTEEQWAAAMGKRLQLYKATVSRRSPYDFDTYTCRKCGKKRDCLGRRLAQELVDNPTSAHDGAVASQVRFGRVPFAPRLGSGRRPTVSLAAHDAMCGAGWSGQFWEAIATSVDYFDEIR